MMMVVVMPMGSDDNFSLAVIAVMMVVVVMMSVFRDPHSGRNISFIGRLQFGRGVGYRI
jgi:hypothetical protein